MKKILFVGFVCLSLSAFAQSSSGQGQVSKGDTPAAKDSASGQLSGKRMHKPITMQDQATGQASGKIDRNKTASDDWEAPGVAAKGSSKSSNGSKGESRVATGDVNGDGHADLTTTKGSGNATAKSAVMSSSSSSQNSRDAATGQASGKRQHQPVVIHKEVDASSPK